VDIHPCTSRIDSPVYPDYIIINLDPSDDDFQKVIDIALAAKKAFDNYKLKAFIKTSGKTGLHLLIPCMNIAFGDSRKLAVKICNGIHELVPEITTKNYRI
jgi:bifunctional non-homologous end joining protein LigD